MTYEALDVVVVPFPFTDQPTVKRRPALVISSNSFNDAHQQSILAMITTSRITWPSDVVIEEWHNAGCSSHARFDSSSLRWITR